MGNVVASVSRPNVFSFVIAIWLLSLLFIPQASPQQAKYGADEVRAVLIAQIIRHLTWPDDRVENEYVVTVWQDNALAQSFAPLNQVRVKNTPIRITEANDLELLLGETTYPHIIFISESQSADLAELGVMLRGTGTVIVTENSDSLHNTMINLVTDKNDNDTASIRFEINRPNIVFEKIKISPELVLFGGSEIDIADLYYQTELAIQELRSQNESTFQQIQAQQQQLSAKEVEFETLQKQSRELSNELADKQRQLSNNQRRLEENETKLNELLTQVEAVDQRFRSAQESAENKTRELRQAEESLESYAEDVESQRAILADLQTEISTTRETLRNQQQKLAIAESEVANQSQVIKQQRDIIYTILFIVVAAILVSVVITKLLLNNKKINADLQNALKDLTETQEQLVESEKLASLGQLVAGVAHEVNTPIGIALTASSTLGADVKLFQERILAGELRKSDVTEFTQKLSDLDELIQGNLFRCHELVENFKQVSADQVVSQNRQVEIKDYCANIMGTLSVLFKHNKVHWRVNGDNPKINLDPGILSQVLTNLATNAVCHAFEGVDKRLVTVDIYNAEDHVSIIFTDNGNGMTEDVRTKLFDPFFTTKRGEGGTGLGMNIVHNLVASKLNGSIIAMSEEGNGTKIEIQIPHPKA